MPFDVECIVVFLVEIFSLQKEPRFVKVRLAMMDTESGTISTLVAQIIDVDDLPGLLDINYLFSGHSQSIIVAGKLGQHQINRRDKIDVIGAIWTDFHAFIT